MIRMTGVKKYYKGFKLDCSMEVKSGYITGIIGKNGAGKSTIFKAILGLIDIDDGEIQIDFKDGSKNLTEKKAHIGVSFADSGFTPYININKVAIIMEGVHKKFDKKLFLERCKAFGLPEHKKIKEFSNGMKAKLKVILATSYESKLLILDEPTLGLDVIAREEVKSMLRDYMDIEGRAIIISSHISSDLEDICDDVYMISDGEIIMHDDMDALINKYGIIKVSMEQFENIDKMRLLKVQKDESQNIYICLTADRKFYMDNYPRIIVEKGNIDGIMTLMLGGKI